MEYAHNGLTPVNWQQPSDIKVLPAFVIRNHIHYGDVEPSPSKDLYPSWYQAPSNVASSQVVDKVSGKAATSCTPASAKETLDNSNAAGFSVDKFVSGALNSGAVSGTDDVHNCSDSPPTVTINNQPLTCTYDSTSNQNNQNNNQGCQISVTAIGGTHPLNDPNYPQYPGTVTVTVNGTNACTLTNIQDSIPSICYFTPTDSGTVHIVATVTDSVLYQSSDNADMDVIVISAKPPKQH
jgi:hypothetical protein